MTLGIDLDGVLVDFNTSFARILNYIEPKHVDIYDSNFFSTWWWWDHYGWSKDAVARAWTEAENCGYFWKMLSPMTNASKDIDKINTLRASGHKVYFLTNRPGKTAKAESEEWLSERGVRFPTVIVGEHASQKADFCRTFGVNWLIDDYPEVLLKVPTTTKAAMIAAPYNKGYHGYFNKTVNSVREALDGVV